MAMQCAKRTDTMLHADIFELHILDICRLVCMVYENVFFV